ncbi:threonine/homoserine/homoserine lactone efflux protein [Rhizobium binae]|uniref:Threonine/homoserine/homoserine lactone efflux protein n=1 Tax=Rhizobium binae TaxID=1138190 RepID=A0ABV2MCR6_9HYPH|nr:LysE family translocator [Rhizobium binae]NKL50822.1 LysE family translocator [Rhizobium leguminosarum bv. viciae]MBX4928881.1 LysE family translocator [Rhizobium binae]MBX4953718.1 LysE family translocator [Rhizobium binae]MBX4992107.1 LysE family translocator [Rhizobium binae]QSY80911.1 LysE family translocator [Rhizobium binae]
MPDIDTFLAFYVAVLAIQLSPGPDMMLVIGRGVGQGRRTALLNAIGITLLAGAIQISLLILGVASLLQTSPLAFDILRWAGAAYLVWLGAKLICRADRHGGGAGAAAQSISTAAALREGTINNLTNPKALVFLFAFLPQFVNPESSWPVAVQLLVLGTVTKLSNFVILSSVAVGAGTLGGWLSRRPMLIAWQERFAGIVMILLGLRLAFSGDARAAR